ncbi:MAG: cytidylate kinase family protein [Spirochaetaceae bacterium]|jgi:cytidylate kinase|nr:cytidylate kinase family protein [Spirochaetaceae bacterium]
MAIITISRQLASLGDETAHELAKLLDYRFVDKLSLEERIKSYGVAGPKLEKYDERKPTLFAAFSQDRDDYLHFLKTAMLAEAGEGSCVFIGRGAFTLFRDLPGVLSVFLVAPMDIRVERVKSYFHCDDKRARQIIEQSDHDRVGFHRYFFDVNWKDPSNYHLTLNMGSLHPALAARIIKELKDETIGAEAEAKHACALNDMALGQQIIHHILYEKGIPVHFLETAVSKGEASLYGVVNVQTQVESAIAAAKDVPGVVRVISEIQVVKEYNVVP